MSEHPWKYAIGLLKAHDSELELLESLKTIGRKELAEKRRVIQATIGFIESHEDEIWEGEN